MKKPIPFGKYYLLERINVGGMAEVFRAKAYGVEGFERLVAVKRILPNIAEDTEFIKMFIDEAKIAVQLNHANIAQIFDLGMVNASYYIALEHIHGRDLRAIFDRCRNHGEPMPVAQACFVVMKVCEGLDYAHNKRDSSGRPLNLVHRDVSPQNIIVSFEGEVKLIDFGIAKAAGKGSKTQAGILKGKFGYMSPEQVRGLPIDRRSDIFSCGIVLYELLTGERLFVGESDFSTLEKVRNVEILPPSTYNRKIPDELERIVLKALAKDQDDRYQNAIDLHDELQAFVYTAGEFYSRKDLAGWSKRVFAREIEEETAKLESYKALRPPEQAGAQPRRKAGKPTAPLRLTLAMPTVAPAPPPIPRRSNGAVAAAAAAAPAAAGLEWDDDELETQIYEGGPEELEPAPLPPASAALGAAGGLAAAAAGEPEPDLSSLVQTAKGWGGGHPGAAPPRDAAPPVNLASGSSNTPSPYPEEEPLMASAEAPAQPDSRDPSAVVRLVNMAQPVFENSFDANPAYAPPPQAKSRTGLYVAIAAAAIILIGGGIGLYFALSGGGTKVADAETTPDQTTTSAAGAVNDKASGALPLAPETNPPTSDLAPEVLKDTGFDLYVEPAAIKDQVTIKVNGKLYATAPPARFRQIAPGDHTIEIEAPRPYESKKEVVTVTAGEAGRVTIRLSADQVVAHFESTPPGADVVLVSDGERTPLGKSPTEAKLDPAKRYEVIFERNGYVGQTKPVEFSGRPEESVVAILARAPSVAHDRSSTSSHSSGTRVASRDSDQSSAPTKTAPRETKHDTSPSSSDHGSSNPFADDSDVGKPPKKDTSTASTGGTGAINIGSKPPCQIYIDGKNTGKMTPQRGLKLPAGRHKITLVNNTYNIKETFGVTVKANDSSTVMKNMMDRIKK